MRVTLRRKRKRADPKTSIAYQAKDMIQKILVDRLGNEALAWYGLELPAIHGPLPSVLSVLTIEKREVDSVYRLADGTILDVEFQSDSMRQKDLERFLRYATILGTHYHTAVTMVVVHLRAHSAAAGLDLGAVVLRLNHVFLAERDGQAAFKRLEAKVGRPDTWESADYLDLAFLPFMRDPTRTQKERALWAAQVAEQLPEPINRYATAMIIGLTSTFVDPEVLNSLKEVIRMNRLVEELEAEARQRGLEQGIEEGLEKGLEKGGSW